MELDDPEQQTFFETRAKEATEGKPWLIALHEKLLSIDGAGVVLWNGSNEEQFVELLLEHGHVYSDTHIEFREGEDNNCHKNAERYAREQPDLYNYATGYALAKRIWRPHSWLFNSEGKRIVETTVRQEMYFGFDYPMKIEGNR